MNTRIQSNASIPYRSWPVLRALWLACAMTALVILVASLPLGYALRFSGPQMAPPVDAPGEYVAAMNVASTLASLAAALTALALAGVLFWRTRDEPMALFVSFYLLGYGIAMAGPLEALFGFGAGPHSDLANRMQGVILVVPTIALLGLFPNGRFVPRWMRWATLASIGFIPLSIAWSPGDWFTVRAPIAWLLLGVIVALFGSSVYAQVYRYRHVSSPMEQQKTKWVLFGVVMWAAAMTLVSVPYVIRLNVPAGAAHPWWAPLSEVGWWLSLTILPLSLAISVMRHRLWDVDILLNRALVYSSLTACTMAIYVFVVAFLGALLQSLGSTLLAFLATGIIALIFQPLRERLQRGVNRLLYGERDDPYAVLARLGQRLETTVTPDAILPTIVETIAEALKLPYVAIALTSPDQAQRIAAACGQSTDPLLRLPLIYQSEPIGELLLAPREQDAPSTIAQRHLLDDLARQVGIATHAVRLTADLQHSREQLVSAREEERRRIRRDLHDGLGPALASLSLKLDAARNFLETNPGQTHILLAEIKSQVQSAIADIRHLVYELRPPALDELGLVSAIREQAAQYNVANGLRVSVIAPANGLPDLPAAAEVAAYRIVLEALTNVVRHARAQECTIQMTLNEDLSIVIRDNGVGLSPSSRSGVGLASMRERAAELGGTCVVEAVRSGGTQVVAKLPVSKR